MAHIENESLYNFERFSSTALSDHADTVERIYTGQLDGVVVEKLLAPETLASAIRQFHEEVNVGPYRQYYYPAPFGHVYGTTLMEQDLEAYFQKATQIETVYNRMFGFDFKAFVVNTLSALSGRQAIQATRYQEHSTFSVAGMRILEPGKEALEAHIHREFPLHFPSYQAVTGQLDLDTELSYYIVLQKPEEGGELVLFGLQWADTSEEMLRSNVFLTGARGQQLEAFDKMLFNLDAGDMILFAANRIWHKVAPVKGQKSRITIGGFLAQHRVEAAYGLFI